MRHAHKIFIRSRKEDSALIYHILEGYEGLASYTTLDFKATDPHRDLELLVTDELKADLELLLSDLGEMIVRLPDHPSKL